MNYGPSTKTARMQATLAQIDSGGAAGRLEICSAGYAMVLSTVVLGYPGSATGVVSGDTLTLSGFPRTDVSIDAEGLAAVARVRNSAGVDVITGLTVGTSNADVILNHVDLAAGRPLTINGATFQHA